MANGKKGEGKPDEAEEFDFEEIFEGIYGSLVEKTRSRLEEEIARDIKVGGVTPDDRLIEAKRQREMFDIDRRHDDEFLRRVLQYALEDACAQLRQRLH